ncbi:MAG: hypothetical protein JRI44_09315 [Deltaproteobacteria bacterium]|nr:hypothetical protein [Deltaproteobacteria bacterium]
MDRELHDHSLIIFETVKDYLLQEGINHKKVIRVNEKGRPIREFNIKAEKLVLNYLGERFPFPVKIFSEESGLIKFKRGKPSFLVLLDPVDGSWNFEHNIPFVGFSMAFFEYKESANSFKDIYSGILGSVFTGDTIYVEKGEEVLFNDKPLSPLPSPSLKKSSIVLPITSLPSKKVKYLSNLLQEVKVVRNFGSCVVEMMQVILGNLDALVDIRNKLSVESFAAGLLAFQELGGVVTDLSGKEIERLEPFSPDYNIIATRTTDLNEEIIKVLK